MKRFFGFVFSCFFLCTSSATALFEFTDQSNIPAWAEIAVERVREADIMTGFGDGSFGPDRILNRAQALAILLRAKGIDYQNRVLDTQFNFSDVPLDQWYTKIVQNGVHEGWIEGFPDGSFRPGAPVNRAEFAIMIKRAFDLERTEDPGFLDVPKTAWFAKPVFNLVANDLVRYIRDNFGPAESVTRADAAWIISEILGKPRLMGESTENNFSLAQKRDAKKVAIKPRNFNPNLQGYEIDRQAIQIEAEPSSEEIISLQRTSDWVRMGEVIFENTLSDTTQLHSLELKLRFERTNIGPVSNFTVRIEEIDGDYSKEENISLTGTVFFGGLNKNIKSGKQLRFLVSLKPRQEQMFFGAKGRGYLAVYDADGSMFTTFVSEHKETSGQNFAPIKMVTRELTHFDFDPTK